MMKLIFLEEAFKYHKGKLLTNLSNILNSIDLPCLANEENDFCEIELEEKEWCNALKYMPNSKSQGNDGLSKKIYEAFWIELKDPFSKPFYHDQNYKELSTSQKQDVANKTP